MAKRCFYATPVNSSNAAFRDWGKKLSDAITAIGLTKSEDTGQIDWTTVTTPATTNTMAGYEIRAFGDSLQSSNPVIVKIEYGSGTNAQYPACVISLGRETDGAGSFIGEFTSRYVASKNSQGSSDQSCFVSGDNSRLEVCMFADSASYNICFWVERVKDDTGANTDLGADMGFMQTNAFQIFFPKKGLQFPISPTYGIPVLVPNEGNSFSYGGNLGIFPVYSHMGYIANPNLSACVFGDQGIASIGSVITVSIYGNNHDFILTGARVGSINGNSGGHLGFAMRYE